MNAASDWNCFGPTACLDHAGLAVRSIAAVARLLPKLPDPSRKVNLAFFQLHGVTIELVEPVSDDSPVSSLLKSRTGVYHLCYRVPNLQAALDEAGRHGFHCIANPMPAPAFNGRFIAWVYHQDFGLFELLEEST